MIHSLNPVAISFGEIQIYWYWLFYIIGFGITLSMSLNLYRKLQVNYNINALYDLFIWGWVAIILGGRLGYVFVYNFEFYVEHPTAIPQIWLGGMSFHGAFAGAAVAAWLVAKKYKISMLDLTDLIVIPLPLALGLGRIGNFINGELWGHPTELPWGIVFPLSEDLIPRHPSQLYQAFTEGLLLFILLFVFKRKIRDKGWLTLLFVIGYTGFRFLIEFFREPDRQLGFYLEWFSMGQLLCIIMFISCFLIIRKLKNTHP